MDTDALHFDQQFFELDGRRCEMSTVRVDGLEELELTLTQHPAPSPEFAALLEAAGLEDDEDGQETWTLEVELPVGFDPRVDTFQPFCSLSAQVVRGERDAALQAGLALARRLQDPTPLAGTWQAKLVAVAGDHTPALVWSDGQLPEIGAVVLTASHELHAAAAWQLLLQLAPDQVGDDVPR